MTLDNLEIISGVFIDAETGEKLFEFIPTEIEEAEDIFLNTNIK